MIQRIQVLNTISTTLSVKAWEFELWKYYFEYFEYQTQDRNVDLGGYFNCMYRIKIGLL